MKFTVAEKIQIALLCDLAKVPGERQIDFDFVRRMAESDHVWALSLRYSDLNLNVPPPPEVEAVREVLAMWDHIERSFSELDLDEKARVKAEAYLSEDPRFPGYCIRRGRERDQQQIVEIFINDLQHWQKFEKRKTGTGYTTVPGYDRMLTIWRRIKTENEIIEGECNVRLFLTKDNLIEILCELISPCDRVMQEDGGWTFKERYGGYFRD